MAEVRADVLGDEKTSEEYRWGIAYLREDIRDLRADLRNALQDVRLEVRENSKRIEGLTERMDQRIEEVKSDVYHMVGASRDELIGRIDGVDQKVEGLRDELIGRIDGVDQKLTGQIHDLDGKLYRQIESVRKEMSTKFLWMMTTMIAIGGIVVAAIKI